MFVKPAPGLKIRHPQSRAHIPETGIEVSETDTFWVRRVIDGDVVVVVPVADVSAVTFYKPAAKKDKE